MTKFRTHISAECTKDLLHKEITVCGWVHRRRDHGGVIFIDLRDRYGLVQIVCDPKISIESHAIADKARPEFVLKATGVLIERPDEMVNPDMQTGEVELEVKSLEIINTSATPPFEIDQDKYVSEDIRMQYRYLDLRKERMKKNMILRHTIIKLIRDFLDSNDFIEIETPILIKGTPEGSREYIVPSRLYHGEFYVLPQSPQQLKQLLMVGGMDKYFQIARCFRDEDQRGDRQPEFTQLDLEMSFVEQEDVIRAIEPMLIEMTESLLPDKQLQIQPFTRLTWSEAMNTYGSDKPDLRFDLSFVDLTEEMKSSSFNVFSSAAKNGVVKAMKVENMAGVPRRELDELQEVAKQHGARGLAYIVYKENELQSPIVKFLSEGEIDIITKKTEAKPGDIVFFSAGDFITAVESLGAVRLDIAKRLDLIDENIFSYVWITDFPLFEQSKETKEIVAVHHPFTAPHPEDIELLKTDPLKVRSVAYDIVLNGNEIGGGSVRIHDAKLQSKIFTTLKISAQDAGERFGHMMKAFTYGAPPHAGIALGIDRLIMLFAGEENIREVIAFPKNQSAQDLMLGAPSSLPIEQIHEANIQPIKKKEQKIDKEC